MKFLYPGGAASGADLGGSSKYSKVIAQQTETHTNTQTDRQHTQTYAGGNNLDNAEQNFGN